MDKHRQTEQRRHTRRKVGVCAWLQFNGDDATRGMVSVDLAPEGAQFSSIRPIEIGERVLVRLQLGPSHPTVECKGAVCWAAPMPNRLNHFGVRFVDLNDDERASIESFLQRPSARPALAAV
ncbi:MAG: PilZ domain-containing protein [Candidatus Hydrogenedentes bacterium]|nr:PilZ domain-containing protein [Candidatus Hydrogenedentota bacterium]